MLRKIEKKRENRLWGPCWTYRLVSIDVDAVGNMHELCSMALSKRAAGIWEYLLGGISKKTPRHNSIQQQHIGRRCIARVMEPPRRFLFQLLILYTPVTWPSTSLYNIYKRENWKTLVYTHRPIMLSICSQLVVTLYIAQKSSSTNISL